MRTLTFEQITDDRFDKNIEALLQKRVNKITSLLSAIEEVDVRHDGIRWVEFPDNTSQCRCRFYVTKQGRKITWNDIYKIINSVNAVPYSFI